MNTSTLPPSSPWPAPPAPPWAPPDPDAEDWALGLGMMIPMGVCLVLCCFCCMFIFKAIASGAPPEAFMMMATPFICFMVVVLSLAAAAVVLGAQGRGPEAMLIFGSVTLALLALPLLLLLLPLCFMAANAMEDESVSVDCDCCDDCGHSLLLCCQSIWCYACNRRAQAVARREALVRAREREARELEQARETRAAEEGGLSLDCDSCGKTLMRFGRARVVGPVFVNGPTVVCGDCYMRLNAAARSDEERNNRANFRRTTVAAAAGLRAAAVPTPPPPAPPLEWTLQRGLSMLAPNDFICTITLSIMEEPVRVTQTGISYEKSALDEWLVAHPHAGERHWRPGLSGTLPAVPPRSPPC